MPPNLVVLLSDQQRADTLGCHGQPLPVTPHLDRLAAEGLRCARAYSCQPVCGPARSALQTGLYPTATGCFRNDVCLPPDITTVPRLLTAAGYDTAYIGKWHLASQDDRLGMTDRFQGKCADQAVPRERRGGWDGHWLASDILEFTSHGYGGWLWDADGVRRDFPPERYRADVLGDWAIAWLEQRRRERPFVLFVSWIEPHHQNDRRRHEGPTGAAARFAGFTPPGDLAADPSGDWPREYAEYLAACAAVDDNVGRIRTALERLGVLDETLLLYSSDHGSHFRTRNGEYKRSAHDASLHVPLILRGPGFRGGRTSDALASLIDIPATLVHAAGLPVPAHWHGRALHDLSAGSPWRDDVFAQISEDHVGRMVRTSRWTYAVQAPGLDGWRVPGADRYVEHLLYDNDADPHQLVNRIADPALGAVRADLRQRLHAWMRRVGEAEAVIAPA